MVWFWDHYVPDAAQRSHPHASPLRAADLAGLPPAYVLIAEHDPLRDEGLAYAAALEAAGVPVTVRRYHDQIHAFFLFVNIMESANQAVSEIAAWIRDGVGES
jgi:acetyl esterase